MNTPQFDLGAMLSAPQTADQAEPGRRQGARRLYRDGRRPVGAALHAKIQRVEDSQHPDGHSDRNTDPHIPSLFSAFARGVSRWDIPVIRPT